MRFAVVFVAIARTVSFGTADEANATAVAAAAAAAGVAKGFIIVVALVAATTLGVEEDAANEACILAFFLDETI